MPDPQQAPPQPQSTTQPLPPEPESILAAVVKATESRLPEVQRFELHQRQARLFALSGLFSDIKGTSLEQALAQAFVKIDLGESMGLSAAEAMTGIDLIQGRVAISANIRAAKMQRAGFSWDVLQLDDKGCRLSLKYKGQQLYREEVDEKTGDVSKVPAVVSFTEQDAARAGLIGKDNYKKNPRNMYFARAITNAQRWYAPGILSVNILSSEEAADLPNESEPAPVPETKKIIDQAPTRTDAVKAVVRRRAQQAESAPSAAQEPSAANPTQTTATTQSTAPPTNDGSQAGTPAKSDPSPETGAVDNPDAEPAGDLFAQQTAKPGPVAVEKQQAKPAPPPIDEGGW
jgi:hypothetical protein